jgi:hypothetical protein
MNEILGYVAVAILGVLGANLARTIFDFLRNRADLAASRIDDTREQVIRHDERLSHGHPHDSPAHRGDRDLVMAITHLTSQLSGLTTGVVELLRENTQQMAKFSGQIEGVNGRLTETLRLFEKRLDRLEDNDRKHAGARHSSGERV